MKYIAINHNGRMVSKPTTRQKAYQASSDYTWATMNASHVIRVVDAPHFMNEFQMKEAGLV